MGDARIDDGFFAGCARIDGAALGEGAFSPGPAIWVGTREVAHLDTDQSLDIRLTKPVIRARREALKADPRVTLRRSTSDWIAVSVATPADLDFARSLVADAVAANIGSAPPGPVPEGADLERRRRFH